MEDEGTAFGVSQARKTRNRIIDEDLRDDTDRLEKIREMRINVLKLFENSLRQITFEDLVVEEQIPDIGYTFLFHCFLNYSNEHSP